MRVEAGKLDQRVTVTRKTRVADGYRGFDVTEAALGTIWARVAPVRGQERVIADRQAAVQTYLVTVRNAGVGAQIAADDVLVWKGLSMNVRAAPEAGRDLYRLVEAETGVVT